MMTVSMMQKVQLLSTVFLIIFGGVGCYVGPELLFWDMDEDRASAKIGMPLFIVLEPPLAAGWEPYTATQNIRDLNNRYRVYECLWTDRPKEWVIYRRTPPPPDTNLNPTYHMFRIFDKDFNSRDFDTESEVIAAIGSVSGVPWITRDSTGDPSLNVVPPLSKKYRVYECVWREGTREWIIINEISPGVYEWGRKNFTF